MTSALTSFPTETIPITGRSFETDYPTTAQLLAQQRGGYDYLGQMYDRDGLGGAGSTLSTATLPYTVDGTKVIYPAATAVNGGKKQHSYASSRVSTTSDLDCYPPPSPSPSIPDSNFSLISRGSNGRLSRRTHATIYLKGTNTNSNAKSRSQVDLTVESESQVPVSELRRAPHDAQHQLITAAATRRSSSSSSSSGRGIQKLTIKMTLKEKKHDSASTPRTTPAALLEQQPDPPHSTTDSQDFLPNGATAASYRKQPYQLSDNMRRAISSSTTRQQQQQTATINTPLRLSTSQVELCKPEIITLQPATTSTTPSVHIPVYERRPPTRDSAMASRAYSQASNSSLGRDPSKPKPHRSYERLDIIGDDGGRVTREVVEEMRGDHISIQVHEKGDNISKDRVAEIHNHEKTDLQRLEQTRPNLEIAMITESDGLLLPEKPPSPPRSRKEKYELSQAMSWKRDITDADVKQPRSRTPVSYEEVEYQPEKKPMSVREETRVAESRSLSAPAPVKPLVDYTARPWYQEQRQPTTYQQPLPSEISSMSSTMYSNTEHQSHISYRSIFDKCYTDERINELRKSANDLRTLADGGLIRPWSTQRESTTKPGTNFKCDYPPTTKYDYPAYKSDHPTTTSNFKCDYPPVSKYDYPATTTTQPPARPLPPYREPSSYSTRASANNNPYDRSKSTGYAPVAPPRTSSTRNDTQYYYQPPAATTKSYTHESKFTTTTMSSSTSSSAYYRPSHTEKDGDYKYITQYKSAPTLPPTASTLRALDPSPYQSNRIEESINIDKTSFAYNKAKSDPAPPLTKGYTPYISTAIGISTLPKPSAKPADVYVPPVPAKPHLATVEALTRRTTGQLPLPRDFIAAAAAVPFERKKEPVTTREVPPAKDSSSFAYKARDPVTLSRYESNTTSTSSTFEKPKFSNEPRSTGSSWAYGHKLPDEQYRSTSADRPSSSTDHGRGSPLKTVEPSVIEALKIKARPEPPSSPDVRPKDWVPPCKAKILQAKRKYLNQQAPFIPPPPSAQDPWERYRSSSRGGSRERIQLRISRESLDAINKEATSGQRTRMSAPDLSGSMRTLTNPSVYRSKIHWPEREVQAKLSESQEYLARLHAAEYPNDDPTTSSFANRWDARSRSLPPMSRYSKSAATTPSETPYPEYMDSNKAKSMEFLADVKKFDYQIVPENQLQRENISGYARPRPTSETNNNDYGDQVRKSLQKLDLPDWYVNSPYSQPGFMEGAILRNRAHSTTDSNYSPCNTLDRSELTSPTGTTQSSDAQVISRRVVPYEVGTRGSRPTLGQPSERTWDAARTRDTMFTGPFYNKNDKKPRPAAIYSPASEINRQNYNPHDSGWSSDWNSHHELSSQESDDSTNGESRSPRNWHSNAPPKKKPVPAPLPISTSSSSAWYVPPLQRRDQSEPARPTRSYSEQRPDKELYRRELPPYPSNPSTYFDPSLSQRRVLQATPWEVTSIKTETIKTEKLAKKNFVTETNDPVKINQFSNSNSQWGSYV